MALIDGLGGSKRWNRWLSVVDRVALSAWNTHLITNLINKGDYNIPSLPVYLVRRVFYVLIEVEQKCKDEKLYESNIKT